MRTLLLLPAFMTGALSHAQDAAPSWLEDSLHGHGKYNAVVVVVAVIIAGIGLWMWRMDRKLRRMERNLKN